MLEANTLVLQELSTWKPKVQADVEELQHSIRTLKQDHITLKQEEVVNPAYMVFDVQHLSLPVSAVAHPVSKPIVTSSGSIDHGDEHSHRGVGNGVVTTIVPTLVIGTRPSATLSPMPFTIGSSILMDASQFLVSQALPLVEFPDFDGSSPKVWIQKCENYFEMYVVPNHLKSRIASMHFIGNATFWAQSLDSPIHSLPWSDLYKAVCEGFGKDQHSMLLRLFFCIRQTESVSDYIEHFDSISTKS